MKCSKLSCRKRARYRITTYTQPNPDLIRNRSEACGEHFDDAVKLAVKPFRDGLGTTYPKVVITHVYYS